MIGTLEEVMKDMKCGVFEFTKDGKCSGCGQCCSNYLPISSKEIKEIKRYVKKHHITELLTLLARSWMIPKKKKNVSFIQ